MNEQRNTNWLGQNWKWLVPIGCLGSLALFAAFIVAIGCLVFGMMKSSGAYQGAVAKAQADPSVQQALGTPIEEGMFVTGAISVGAGSGQADLSIPIRGPDGQATIQVVAEQSAGQWTFSTLVVEIKNSRQRIDLLEAEKRGHH